MLPCNPGGHAAYQDTFVSDFLKFYPDPFVLPKSTWNYIVQFWYLDLSQTDSIMQECYSVFGPEPRLPSCMLRSYLLALKLKVTSITVWCRMLRETPLYAILSGFPFGDTPGVGTFYDFFSRIWQDDSDNLSPKDRFPKMKPPKGKKKGDKTPCDSSSTASKLLPLLEHWKLKPENPFSLVFRLYQQQFLDRSIQKGLIDPDHLALAGDGTPVRTAAQQRKNRICDCKEKGCSSCSCKTILIEKVKEVLGLPEINQTIVQEHISRIMVPEHNHLIFELKNGSSVDIFWKHPSRRLSWTDEMREAARQKTLMRYRKEEKL